MKSIKACKIAIQRLRDLLKVIDNEDYKYTLRGMLMDYKKQYKKLELELIEAANTDYSWAKGL